MPEEVNEFRFEMVVQCHDCAEPLEWFPIFDSGKRKLFQIVVSACPVCYAANDESDLIEDLLERASNA